VDGAASAPPDEAIEHDDQAAQQVQEAKRELQRHISIASSNGDDGPDESGRVKWSQLAANNPEIIKNLVAAFMAPSASSSSSGSKSDQVMLPSSTRNVCQPAPASLVPASGQQENVDAPSMPHAPAVAAPMVEPGSMSAPDQAEHGVPSVKPPAFLDAAARSDAIITSGVSFLIAAALVVKVKDVDDVIQK
jgi:hypothetical protein